VPVVREAVPYKGAKNCRKVSVSLINNWVFSTAKNGTYLSNGCPYVVVILHHEKETSNQHQK